MIFSKNRAQFATTANRRATREGHAEKAFDLQNRAIGRDHATTTGADDVVTPTVGANVLTLGQSGGALQRTPRSPRKNASKSAISSGVVEG